MAHINKVNSAYFLELLTSSIALVGDEAVVLSNDTLPYSRLAAWLDVGRINLHWFLSTPERDQKYIPINVGITNGLVGHRILLIREKDQGVFRTITSIEDFKQRKLAAGFVKGWFDAAIWQVNKMPYYDGVTSNASLPRMIAAGNRGVDYFSTDAISTLRLSQKYPFLTIEKELLLIYEKDFKFYLARQYEHLKPMLEHALSEAKKTGLIDQLIDKHWGEGLRQLQLNSRRNIYLETP